MKRHLHNLFIPHHGNNHKPKLLHHFSLSKLILLVVLVQLFLSGISQVKPGVLGYASNITVEDVVGLTNAQRQAAGLSSLSVNASLSDSARQKAAHMFAYNYWAHNAPDGTSPWYFFKNVKYEYLYAGENLARDFGDSKSVMEAWIASPTHRDNILSGRYNEIGIAVVNGLLDGQETTLVVQHFGKAASAQAAVLPAPAAEIAGVNQAAQPEAQPAVALTEPPLEAAQEPVEDVVADLQSRPSSTLEYTGYQKTLGENLLLQARSASQPFLSAFDLTKSVNLALGIIIVLVLALDAFLIWHRGTTRRSGKSFVHLSLFILVVLIILLTNSGKII